ncbi:MAG: amidohydrolase family protein [Anaerolineae bacterium]|nr:amidohydrolase family protein [Anaerolineae bacterium]
MTRIDAHVHYCGDHDECIAALSAMDLRLLNVCVASTPRGEQWRKEADAFSGLVHVYPQTYAWCTSFDIPDFNNPHYMDNVINQLEIDFANGAVACKLWKNIGMEIRKPDGQFLMVDDPLFSPMYAYLTRIGKPLLMHTGEPLACWQPLNTENPHYGYYSAHPEWHMFNKKGFPSHQDIINARDRVLERHPELKVIGAHLGSLEYDVSELAKRLDRYPNFAVDTSARTHDLSCQGRDKVRQFFLDYQDRILFGTDIVQRDRQSSLPDIQRKDNLAIIRKMYEREFSYYETGNEMNIRGRTVKGLALPEQALDKFYTHNAERWYAGL